MSDLVLIAIPIISGLSGVLGVLAGGMLQLRAGREDRSAQHSREYWIAKRDAYARLLQAMDKSLGEVNEIMATRDANTGIRTVSKEVADEFAEAAASARLLAPSEVWGRIEPYYLAVIYRANAQVPGLGQESLEQLKELGGDKLDKLGNLRVEMLAAMHEDLMPGKTTSKSPKDVTSPALGRE